MTRCQGRLYFVVEECKIHETCLAALGFPANLAINPYVKTLPLGIFLII